MTRMYVKQGELEVMVAAKGPDQGEERDGNSCLKWKKAIRYGAVIYEGSVTNPYGRYSLEWDNERGLYYIQFDSSWLMLLPDPETAVPSILKKLVLEFTLQEKLLRQEFAHENPRGAGVYKSGVAVAWVTADKDRQHDRHIQIRGMSVKDVIRLFEMLVDGSTI